MSAEDPFLEVIRREHANYTWIEANNLNEASALLVQDQVMGLEIATEYYYQKIEASDNEMVKFTLALESAKHMQAFQIAVADVKDKIRPILRSLAAQGTLRFLSLAQCELNDLSGDLFAEVLISTPIRTLNLHSNALGNKTAAAIAKALESQSTVQIMNLSNNEIGDEGAARLCKALGKNKHVQYLNFSFNQFGQVAGLELAAALKKSSKVRFVNLVGNKGIPTDLCEEIKTTCLETHRQVVLPKGSIAFSQSKVIRMSECRAALQAADELKAEIDSMFGKLTDGQ